MRFEEFIINSTDDAKDFETFVATYGTSIIKGMFDYGCLQVITIDDKLKLKFVAQVLNEKKYEAKLKEATQPAEPPRVAEEKKE